MPKIARTSKLFVALSFAFERIYKYINLSDDPTLFLDLYVCVRACVCACDLIFILDQKNRPFRVQ